MGWRLSSSMTSFLSSGGVRLLLPCQSLSRLTHSQSVGSRPATLVVVSGDRQVEVSSVRGEGPASIKRSTGKNHYRLTASLVSLPRVERYEGQVLTVDQAPKLLEVARGSRLDVLLLVALTMGMRKGELVA